MFIFLFIVLCVIVLLAWLIARIFGRSSAAKPPALLPQVGMTLPGAFLHRREAVHVFCRIEDSEESRLLVRVLSELGKSSLLGMRAGTPGQLEVGNNWLPIEVLNVSLPWVIVEAFAGRAKPKRRESLRVSASFSVRFRAQGLVHRWTPGTGINISAGGFCFSSNHASQLRVGRYYEIELTPDDAVKVRRLSYFTPRCAGCCARRREPWPGCNWPIGRSREIWRDLSLIWNTD